jgi:hypothetical protein
MSQPQIGSFETEAACRERSESSHKSRISMVFENKSEETSSKHLPPLQDGKQAEIELSSNQEPS